MPKFDSTTLALFGRSKKHRSLNRINNHTGKRYGKLLVLGYLGSYPEGKNNEAYWLCICKCGTPRIVSQHSFRTVTSCGCSRQTHGKTQTRAYRSWSDMMRRCYDLKCKAYKYYGGRGITVCERWHDMEAFFADMGECPPDKDSIDRIDYNGNYEPENCRWATDIQQARNKSSNRLLTIDGETLCIAEWAERTHTKTGNICNRLRYGWTPRDAVFLPVSHGKYNSRKD